MGPKQPTTAHIHIPPAPPAAVPSHARPSPGVDLQRLADAIARGKRVVVVCGAGVSVAAGIPDFRSPAGLFKSLKEDNPSELLTSGKDLFDTRVFQSPQTLALFNKTMAALALTSAQAQPTIFHGLLRKMEDRGRLLRVYTQNIDALEEKAGLELGVPVWPAREKKGPIMGRRGVKRKAEAMLSTPSTSTSVLGSHMVAGTSPTNAVDDTASVSRSNDGDMTPASTPRQPTVPLPPVPGPPLPNPALNGLLTPPKTPSRNTSPATQASTTTARTSHPPAAKSRPSTPSFRAPRCIPVHGTLRSLYCVSCGYNTPLETKLSILSTGASPSCPKCEEIDTARQAQNKRSRGIGRLRPSVVLYGEEHKEGEAVGECVRRDLVGLGDAGPGERAKQSRRPDLLVVVGTSLQVPGTRRIVKEFSKAVRPILSAEPEEKPLARTDDHGRMDADVDVDVDIDGEADGEGERGRQVTEVDIFGAPDSPLTPLSSDSDPFFAPTPPRKRPPPKPATSQPEQSAIRTVYVNFDYPTPARDWEGVFDVWVQGDAQVFARAVADALARVEREERQAEAERERREAQRELLLARREEERERARKEEEAAREMLSRQKLAPPTKVKPKAKIPAAHKVNSGRQRNSWRKPVPPTPSTPARRPPQPRPPNKHQLRPSPPPPPYTTPMKATAHLLPATPESLARYTPHLPQPTITPSPVSPLRLKIRFPPGFWASMNSLFTPSTLRTAPVTNHSYEEEEDEEEDEDSEAEEVVEGDGSPRRPNQSEYMRKVGLGLRKRKELNYRV